MKRISIVLLAILAFTCLFVSCKKEPEPVHTHEFDAGIETVHPSETQDGLIVYTCTTCGYKKEEVLPAGHDFDEKRQCRFCKGYKCGDYVVAVFDDATNTMTFKGKGLVYDFESNYNSNNEKNSLNLWGKDIHDKINNAVFEDGVVGTGEYILSYATNLTSVKFGKDVIEISPSSFYECEKLSTVDFGSSKVKDIGNYAFSGTNISSMNLPFSLETIGSGCFQESKLSGEVELPEGLKFMDRDVFYGTQIKALSIPSTLSPNLASGSGSSCLGNVRTLEKFTVSEGNPYMKASDNGKALVSIDGTTLIAVAAGAEDFVIPSGIKVVGLHSFRGWKGTSIVVPEGVTKIEDSAFRGCSSLLSVKLPSSLESISGNAFEYCRNLKEITIHKPEGSLEGYETCWMKDPYDDMKIEIIWNN